jgi:hypothetical protein
VETLSAVAVEGNGGITKDVVDEIVHSRFRELAAFVTDAREASGSLDFLVEELVDI